MLFLRVWKVMKITCCCIQEDTCVIMLRYLFNFDAKLTQVLWPTRAIQACSSQYKNIIPRTKIFTPSTKKYYTQYKIIIQVQKYFCSGNDIFVLPMYPIRKYHSLYKNIFVPEVIFFNWE